MPSLFDPIDLRNGSVSRNRIALAPMTNLQSAPDGTLGDDELRWLARRADDGFGIVMTCAAYVATDGKAWAGQLGVHDDRCIDGLRRLAGRIHDGGALAYVQLFHGGVRAASKHSGTRPWSASEFHEEGKSFEAPRAATEDDLARVIDQFAAAARRVLEAGFDGIELHGAHGYLLSQFLSTTMNRRDDRWGGPLANRALLIREVTRAVRAAVPIEVGVRLSPEDFGYARGLDLDETVEVAGWLADDGADFIHASLWDVHAASKKRPETGALPLFRAALPAATRLWAAGSVWTRAEAEGVLAAGADIVALGRAAILNPDWARAASDPAWQPRRPPMSAEELGARSVSPTFVEYLRRWKDFVAP